MAVSTCVACVSRSLNPAERNYAAWKGELLAAVYGIKAFRAYLLGQQFQLITDHRALLWLLTHKAPVGQQARWVLSLSEYQFSLVHRAGINNPADVPSREPLACAADWTGSRLDTREECCALPTVYLADGSTLDPAAYSHDQLAIDLGLQPSSAAAAAAGVVSSSSPAAALAGDAWRRVPTATESAAHLLHALSAISAASSQLDAYDNSLAPLLGGGTDAAEAAVFNSSAAHAWQPAALRQQAGSWVSKAQAETPALVMQQSAVLNHAAAGCAWLAHSISGSHLLSSSNQRWSHSL